MIEAKWKDNGEGIFEYKEGPEAAVSGFMDLLQTESGKLVIKHTEVDENMSGRGIGKQLLEAVADYSRANDLKILPVCPFAKNIMYRFPDKYKDLL
ncbi:GNAT family N-acetyltransferase [Croceimicrobium hydrocarbonivorans]|uniref:N-acetyltransferase n=1 Tax=Croceimicrobium hydrocarbonivorans TaxID=2761580 RepID=A0A7H0VFC1_9FLAO|nr:GNAT family N-acetyltransferase [Croceimicrobium hydrocarbonivorans]QNR24419.1 N-acetyltransferase [Croceimicrobium hydrocarbonivorans]